MVFLSESRLGLYFVIQFLSGVLCSALISNPLSPMFVIARDVQDRCHNNRMFRFQNFVDGAIGKSFGVVTADVFARMTAAVEQGTFRQRIPDLNDFFDEFRTESDLL
jgi:hypothetical protein